MSLVARVTVRVPASTSNLGPGFDSLGLALNLYNYLTLELHSGTGRTQVILSGEGEGRLPPGEDNLIVRAARRILGRKNYGRLLFKTKNNIPIAKGLGSSAAAIVAGLAAANALRSRLTKTPPLDLDALEDMATGIEGHIGNVAACLRGGLIVTFAHGRRCESHRGRMHPSLSAAVCLPDFELPTKKARAALPKKVPLADAAENTGRSFLLALSLSRGDWENLSAAMKDRLHQPYRMPLVRGLKDVILAAERGGSTGAALSGAGPSLVALGPKSPTALAGRRMKAAFKRRGIKSRVLLLRPDTRGAVVQK